MGSCGLAAFDFPRFPLGSRNAFFVLRMTLVNGRGVDILVVICSDAESLFVLRKLVPATCVRRALQATIEAITRVGYPRLKGALGKSTIRNGSIGTKSALRTIMATPCGH